MRRLIISKSTADFTSHAGLGLVGMAIRDRTNLATDAAAVSALRSDAMPYGDMLASYVALLCLGKSDCEAIDAFRNDPFFLEALGLERAPSAAILRQRLDANAADFKDAVIVAAIEFLRRSEAPITPLGNGLVPLDADVAPMNNAKTKKKGVARTYKGENGFAPTAAYLRQEGYCLELELREGSQHSQKGPPELAGQHRQGLKNIGPAERRRLVLTTAAPRLDLDGVAHHRRLGRIGPHPGGDAACSGCSGSAAPWPGRGLPVIAAQHVGHEPHQ
ncbi:transposase [uncultured Thiodictyon sp.]|uniref:transposase n=1 Tax=uncultured Thiodictyon sp. TaxID=1846217 RepID=UPI0025FBEF28|nr:transposase [uncultured Thiodictyon sp.]